MEEVLGFLQGSGSSFQVATSARTACAGFRREMLHSGKAFPRRPRDSSPDSLQHLRLIGERDLTSEL